MRCILFRTLTIESDLSPQTVRNNRKSSTCHIPNMVCSPFLCLFRKDLKFQHRYFGRIVLELLADDTVYAKPPELNSDYPELVIVNGRQIFIVVFRNLLQRNTEK